MPGVINHEEGTYSFVMAEGNTNTTLSSKDSNSISTGNKFVLSCGGFDSEEDAFNTGKRVKDSLLLSGIKLRMGLDAGRDKARSWLGISVKDMMLKEHGVRIIDDIHGLSVYSEEYPILTGSASGVVIFSPIDAENFTSMLSVLYQRMPEISDKVRLSLELYAASHFEKSDRARFITLVLAIEALLEPKKRKNSAKEVVDGLIKYAKDSQLDDQVKNSFIGSLKWLYKESISYSLQEMAENYLIDRKYGDKSAKNFIKHCYDVRSKLVHNGRVDVEEANIGTLAAQLNLFLSDLLIEMTGIRSI